MVSGGAVPLSWVVTSLMESNNFNPTQTTSSPILLNHAVTDTVIPHSHSARLFEDLRSHSQVPPARVHDTHYGGWGHVRSFTRDHVAAGPVFWWEGLAGGHNNLGWTEGVMDLIAKVAGL
jgi:abhydrolase domain-containing protein 12